MALNPTIVECNGCGTRIKFHLTKLHIWEQPAALYVTLRDTLGVQYPYCPACGPNSPDDYDSVEML